MLNRDMKIGMERRWEKIKCPSQNFETTLRILKYMQMESNKKLKTGDQRKELHNNWLKIFQYDESFKATNTEAQLTQGQEV